MIELFTGLIALFFMVWGIVKIYWWIRVGLNTRKVHKKEQEWHHIRSFTADDISYLFHRTAELDKKAERLMDLIQEHKKEHTNIETMRTAATKKYQEAAAMKREVDKIITVKHLKKTIEKEAKKHGWR